MLAKVVIENDWLSWCAKFVIARDLVHLIPVLVLLGRMAADSDSIMSDL